MKRLGSLKSRPGPVAFLLPRSVYITGVELNVGRGMRPDLTESVTSPG